MPSGQYISSMETSDKKQEDASQQPVGLPVKHARTAGLKLFDVLLYPLLTNFGVFAISVAATYLTSRGGDRLHNGELKYGKVGQWFHKRGEWMVNKFKALGMSEKQADMSKMVFFSFADGSAMAPLVKKLEDHREDIGRKLDDMMGTTPADPGVYEAEPKQSWLSVLGGRVVTLGMVLPTAKILDHTGLNDKMFIEPGKRMGEWLNNKPGARKFFGKFDVKELAKVSLFEFFYTSLCTAGLYLTSRRIAYFTNDEEKNASPAAAGPAAPVAEEESAPQKSFAHDGLKSKPIAADIVPASHVEKISAHAADASYSLSA